ncbi:hypothetical protein BCR42DRAFT_404853 [Absidia repens]|uniref:Uncharacterized protein n=1 Tax=Absidia repens TaxID=90262 RepID=A0A1X2IWQ0_9FUNG|nr:hypothetical protein BCR42DRAFT_404853 [Absidia repens]
MTNSISHTDCESAHNDSQIYYKPDTIEPVATDHTQTNLKPDAVDTPVYEKPNAYEDLSEQVDDLALGIQATQLDHEATQQDEDDDGEEPIHTTIVRYKTRKTKMAPPSATTPSSTPTPTSLPPHTWSSSSLLSHGSSTATTITTIQTEDELLAQDKRHHHRPLSTTSLDTQAISPSISSTSTVDSANSSATATSSSTSKQMLLDSLKRRPMEDVAKYDLRKHSLVQPHHHDIYIGGTKKLLFRKRQPHSYSWGFQNILYRVDDNHGHHQHPRLGRHGTKVAEARRRAFQKQITVEWGIDEKEWDEKSNKSTTTEEDDALAYKGREGKQGDQDNGDDDEEDAADQQDGTKSNHLINTNNTRLLFVYTTLFANGFYLRWKRPSLVSHDLICEIRRVDSDDDNDNNDDKNTGTDNCGSMRKSRKKKDKKKWQLLAEFDSHGMGYLIHIGQLVVDKRSLALVDRPEHLEAHLLITCCTLVDFMRELVQKAVGLSNGGVAQ